MKSIIYLAFIALTSIGVYAQENTEQNIAESTKATATKISQELNFDDSKTLYLYRALYSTEQTKQRANDQLAGNEDQLTEMLQKVDNQFVKMLQAKFSESEIANIKELMVEEE